MTDLAKMTDAFIRNRERCPQIDWRDNPVLHVGDFVAVNPDVALSLLRELAAARKVVEAVRAKYMRGRLTDEEREDADDSLEHSMKAYDRDTTKTEAEGKS